MRSSALALLVVLAGCSSAPTAAPPAAGTTRKLTPRLPHALHVKNFPEHPAVVEAVGRTVTVDGEPVGPVDSPPRVGFGPVARALNDRLEKRGEDPFLVLRFDVAVPAAVVKNVMRDAATAGYKQALFAVLDAEGRERGLPVDALVGDPRRVEVSTSAVGPAPQQTLHVEVDAARTTLTWAKGWAFAPRGESITTPVVVPHDRLAELADAVTQSWLEHGVHRELWDIDSDKAALHAGDAVPYERLVAVVDALVRNERRISSHASSYNSAILEVYLAFD